MVSELTLPTFLGCGAPRAGTTSLYRLLSYHPQVGLSKKKEVLFFVDGEWLYGWDRLPRNYSKGLQWYAQFFEDVRDKPARGEISPWYLVSPPARRRIRKDLRNVKLIFTLRDPVERMYSHFRGRRRAFDEKISSFEKVEQSKWLWMYVEFGLYYKHLLPWLEEFPNERILIIFFEEFKQDQLKLLNRVSRFLGVPELKELPVAVHENFGRDIPAWFPVSRGMYRLARSLYHAVVPKSMSKRLSPRRWLEVQPAPISNEVRVRLIEKYFYDDIVHLQRLLGVSLQSWLEPCE